MKNESWTPVLVLLVGGIASGKSTVRKLIALGAASTYGNCVSICPDDIRQELSGDAGNQSVNKAAWDTAYSILDAAMVAREPVIVFDAAYMVKSRTRKNMQAYAVRHGYRVVYVILDTPISDQYENNAQRERRVPDDVVARYAIDFTREFPFVIEDKKING